MDFMSKPSGGVGNSSLPGAVGSAKSLVKGLGIVDLVSERPQPVRLQALVEATGLPRPTLLRLVEALVDHGLLEIDAAGGYRLGPHTAAWGQRYLTGLDVRTLAVDVMADVVRHTDETCFLGIRDRRWVLYVAKSASSQAVQLAAQVGSRNPLHSTGMGKALLAHAGPAVVAEYLAWPLEARTPRTITQARALRAELARIRDVGYSVDDIENEDGVRCIAVAVRDHSGTVVAALSLAAPAYRVGLEALRGLAPTLLGAAAELSGRLGYLDVRGATNDPAMMSRP